MRGCRTPFLPNKAIFRGLSRETGDAKIQRRDAGSCRWGEPKGTESPAVRGSRIDCKVLREDGHGTQPRSSKSPHSAARGGGRSSSSHHELGTYREERRWFEVRRLVSAFAVAIVVLLFALPAAAQDDDPQVCD